MDILDDEILNLWKALNREKVLYIMVGGFATNLNGFSRTTADLDLWIKDTQENRNSFVKALNSVNIKNIDFLKSNPIIAGWTTIKLDSGFELDLMTEIKNFGNSDFDECYKLAPIAVISEVPIKFLHINHLIEEKRKSGRPKDLIDLEELEKIRSGKV